MNDQYTPTTEELTEWIAMVDGIVGHGGESLARFKRWLTAHDARIASEAAERGWDEAMRASDESWAKRIGWAKSTPTDREAFPDTPPNPYRAERKDRS